MITHLKKVWILFFYRYTTPIKRQEVVYNEFKKFARNA